MQPNALFFAWNRSIPGRESTSATHFEEFVAYLSGLQQSGAIASFDVAFLNPHGGDLNGFFLVKGTGDQISALAASTEWITHMTRASLHLEGSGFVPAASGDAVMERMGLWTSLLP